MVRLVCRDFVLLGMLLYPAAVDAQTVIHTSFEDDFRQDSKSLTGWYIYDDRSGNKGNPLVSSQYTGKIYHGPTMRDTNQGYYHRKFQCASRSKVTWSADIYYCSSDSSVSNTVHTYFNGEDFGNSFGWVSSGSGIPYMDQALIDATGCHNWEYRKLYEPNANVDTGVPPVVEANESFDFAFKFRLVGNDDFVAVSNFKIECKDDSSSAHLESNMAKFTSDINSLVVRVGVAERNLNHTRNDVAMLQDETLNVDSAITTLVSDVSQLGFDFVNLTTKVEATVGRMKTSEGHISKLTAHLSTVDKKVTGHKSEILSLKNRVLACKNYTKVGPQYELYCEDDSEVMITCNLMNGDTRRVQTNVRGRRYCSNKKELVALCCKLAE